jgi:hypothetical protein
MADVSVIIPIWNWTTGDHAGHHGAVQGAGWAALEADRGRQQLHR